MVELSVVQRAPGTGSVLPGAVVWRTCLRELAFVDGRTANAGSDEVFQGTAAYTHLLEVICGLDSPILGETEVMHQFKAFVAGLPGEHVALREVGQRLLNDARAVRAQHLIGLGSRSYGSAVRRHVRDATRVALVGTGMLEADLLPFLADEGRTVDLWGRRDAVDLAAPGLTYRRLTNLRTTPLLDGPAVMVVAAPVASATISDLSARYARLMRLVDLRAEAADDPPPALPHVISLQDVFGEVSRAASPADRQVAAARDEIRRCALAYATREKLRPSGWHDLCA